MASKPEAPKKRGRPLLRDDATTKAAARGSVSVTDFFKKDESKKSTSDENEDKTEDTTTEEVVGE